MVHYKSFDSQTKKAARVECPFSRVNTVWLHFFDIKNKRTPFSFWFSIIQLWNGVVDSTILAWLCTRSTFFSLRGVNLFCSFLVHYKLYIFMAWWWRRQQWMNKVPNNFINHSLNDRHGNKNTITKNIEYLMNIPRSISHSDTFREKKNRANFRQWQSKMNNFTKMIQFVRGVMNHLILMLYCNLLHATPNGRPWCLFYLAHNEGKSTVYNVASDCDIENCSKFQPKEAERGATPTNATDRIL